jgi:hypothetical protein
MAGNNGQPAERVTYSCPVCRGGNGAADWKLTRHGYEDWLISCFSGSCQSMGGAYLQALASALGQPGASKDELVKLLRSQTPSRSSRRAVKEPLPTRREVEASSSALLASEEPLAYLTERRGLSVEVIEAARIGWDGRRLVFPMFRGGELVAFKTRLPRDKAQMKNCAGRGRPWPLYPGVRDVAAVHGWVLLVAGELDALRGRTAGLPVASVTLGAGTWREEWTEELDGCHVVVCFDNNERTQARARTAALREAGIDAMRLDLRRDLGLRDPKGDLSDYLDHRGSARLLRQAIRRRRRKNASTLGSTP